MEGNIKHLVETIEIAKARGTKREEELNGTRADIDKVLKDSTYAIATQLIMLQAYMEVVGNKPFTKKPFTKAKVNEAYTRLLKEFAEKHGTA